MKPNQVYEVLHSILEAERNPMVSEVAFLLGEGYIAYREEPGRNKNNTTQKYRLTDEGMDLYQKFQAGMDLD